MNASKRKPGGNSMKGAPSTQDVIASMKTELQSLDVRYFVSREPVAAAEASQYRGGSQFSFLLQLGSGSVLTCLLVCFVLFRFVWCGTEQKGGSRRRIWRQRCSSAPTGPRWCATCADRARWWPTTFCRVCAGGACPTTVCSMRNGGDDGRGSPYRRARSVRSVPIHCLVDAALNASHTHTTVKETFPSSPSSSSSSSSSWKKKKQSNRSRRIQKKSHSKVRMPSR